MAGSPGGFLEAWGWFQLLPTTTSIYRLPFRSLDSPSDFHQGVLTIIRVSWDLCHPFFWHTSKERKGEKRRAEEGWGPVMCWSRQEPLPLPSPPLLPALPCPHPDTCSFLPPPCFVCEGGSEGYSTALHYRGAAVPVVKPRLDGAASPPTEATAAAALFCKEEKPPSWRARDRSEREAC